MGRANCSSPESPKSSPGAIVAAPSHQPPTISPSARVIYTESRGFIIFPLFAAASTIRSAFPGPSRPHSTRTQSRARARGGASPPTLRYASPRAVAPPRRRPSQHLAHRPRPNCRRRSNQPFTPNRSRAVRAAAVGWRGVFFVGHHDQHGHRDMRQMSGQRFHLKLVGGRVKATAVSAGRRPFFRSTPPD